MSTKCANVQMCKSMFFIQKGAKVQNAKDANGVDKWTNRLDKHLTLTN